MPHQPGVPQGDGELATDHVPTLARSSVSVAWGRVEGMTSTTRDAALAALRDLVGRPDAGFHDGQYEAIEALDEKNGAVDLVVSDVVMPEMDGPTLLKEMRGRNPDLKIIFVSGYAEDAFEKSLPENEQFAFLPKPFTLTQLVAAVKETMTPQ